MGYFASRGKIATAFFHLKGFEIFIYFFINSGSNLTQTQMLTPKLFPNRTLTKTLTPKIANKKARMNISHFRFILFNLKICGEILTTFLFS